MHRRTDWHRDGHRRRDHGRQRPSRARRHRRRAGRGLHLREPPAADPARPVTIAPAAATGRRKEAVARVRIVPGTGLWTINGRNLDAYFPNKLHQQLVNSPFKLLDLDGRFDVIARIPGGGITGQAGALRLGVARVAELDRRGANRPALKKAGFLTRDARVDGAQEGRSEEGPQGAAVLEALIRRRRSGCDAAAHLRHRRCPWPRQRGRHRRARARPRGSPRLASRASDHGEFAGHRPRRRRRPGHARLGGVPRARGRRRAGLGGGRRAPLGVLPTPASRS